MKYIIGLGNPDAKYQKTYHNIGYIFADKVAEKIGAEFSKTKCKAYFAEGMYNGEKIRIFKPTTYMNLSGECVVEVMNKFGAKPEEIIVGLDDIDLPVGKYRFREKGSAGTHNGLRNIVSLTGREDIKRIRFGIGRSEKIDLIDYVLSTINEENFKEISKAIEEGIEFLFEKVI